MPDITKYFCLMMTIVLCKGADWHRKVFYDEITKFRNNPHMYQKDHPDVVVRCSDILEDTIYQPLYISGALENSSYFQAWTLSRPECPIISHDTCEYYCDQFGGSCSYVDRIEWFLQDTEHNNVREILIKGPKNPYNLFYYFLGSEPHCNHILNQGINAMGASFSRVDKNVFVVDFAYIHV